MTPDVVHVSPAGDMTLLLTFADGQRRILDAAQLGPFVGVFAPLLDPAFFRRVSVNPDLGTIVWPNGADVCPEVLLTKSRPIADGQAA